MSIVPGAVLMRISTPYARRGEVWRLFTELQEKNRALTQAHTQATEALEQQTATSEILRVISRSTARPGRPVRPAIHVPRAQAARAGGVVNCGSVTRWGVGRRLHR